MLITIYIWSCKTGKHTAEKPVIAKAAAAPKQPVSAPTHLANSSAKDACPRCRQGFFCSDHGIFVSVGWTFFFFFFLSVLLLRLNDFYKNYDIIKQVMQVQHKQKSTVLA